LFKNVRQNLTAAKGIPTLDPELRNEKPSIFAPLTSTLQLIQLMT
jgi:hypothetical protein